MDFIHLVKYQSDVLGNSGVIPRAGSDTRGLGPGRICNAQIHTLGQEIRPMRRCQEVLEALRVKLDV